MGMSTLSEDGEKYSLNVDKNNFMDTWGTTPKSQTDNETVEGAINRLIAAHEADPDAHLGMGESLQSHRASEIIDHEARSIVADKFAEGSIMYRPYLPDGYQPDNVGMQFYKGAGYFNVNNPTIMTGDQDVWFYDILPADNGYAGGDFEMEISAFVSSFAGTFASKIGFGFFELEFKYLDWRINWFDGTWHSSSWFGDNPNFLTKYTVFYSSVDGKIYFKRNGVQVYSLTQALIFENDEFMVWMRINRGTSSQSGLFVQNFGFTFDGITI